MKQWKRRISLLRLVWPFLLPFFIFLFLFYRPVSASFVETITNFVVTIWGARVYQESFRFYAPQNSLAPNDFWPPGSLTTDENAGLTENNFPPLYGQAIRLRTGLKITNADLETGKKQFKLQFAKLNSGTCSQISSWTDLGNPDSSAAWRGFSYQGLDNQTVLPSNLLSGATVAGTYQDRNSTPLNPFISQNAVIEYDWSIQNNISSPDGATYCFRMAESGGSIFNGYNRYPQMEVTPEIKQSASGTIDAASGGTVSLTNSDNTQFIVTAPINYLSVSHSFNLFSFDYSQYLDKIGGITPSGKVGANSFIYRFVALSGGGIASDSFDRNLTIKIKYNASDISSITESSLQIFKFDGQNWNGLDTALDTNAKLAAAEIASTSAFGLFGDLAPTPTPTPTSTPTPTPAPGGGGGGGIFIPKPAAVELKGFAYPKATVDILRDAQLIGTAVADSNGFFAFTDSGLAGGSYNFGLIATDTEGRKSALLSLVLNVSAQSLTSVTGILMPPTISIDKNELSKGESLNVRGQAILESILVIEIFPEEAEYRTAVQKSGGYSIKIPTGNLKEGIHMVRAKEETKEGDESTFSNVLGFGLGVPYEKKKFEIPKIGFREIPDFNGDGRINIVDVSIMIYWYKKAVPAGFFADLNQNGLVDMPDFSILVFYWTG